MKKKIVYICAFSNKELRENLDLQSYDLGNKLRKWLGKPTIRREDYGPWNPQFIKGFEDDPNNEYFIICPHNGLRHKCQEFTIRGIHYFVYNWSVGVLNIFLKTIFNWEEKSDYIYYRKQIKKIIAEISPDLIVVGGAENPIYSWAAMDVPDSTPTFILLQSLMNDPKRIAMGVSSPYRRSLESKILHKHHYFGVVEGCAKGYLLKENPKAIQFEIDYPCNNPCVVSQEKKYDFIFVAGGITKNKGVEDVIKSMAIVHQTVPNATLNISGSIQSQYKEELQNMIEKLKLQDVVSFQPAFAMISDVYTHMTNARCIVVPGITAALNSTVKESMLLGLPTICYETSVTPEINREKECLITAKMEDIDDLASKMANTISQPNWANMVAKNGQIYAKKRFTADAIGIRLRNYFTSILIQASNTNEND